MSEAREVATDTELSQVELAWLEARLAEVIDTAKAIRAACVGLA